jgi:hypothetical protein
MKLGDIFRNTFSTSNDRLTLVDITKRTPKNPDYKTYGAGIVSKRGNIFKNRNINIDKMVDESLKHPLSSIR